MTRLYRLGAAAVSPRTWRIATRRAFLLCLPVALPLWLLSLATLGVFFTLRAFSRPIAAFWSAPPKRRNSGYYGYSYRGARSSSKVVHLTHEKVDKAA